MVKDRRARTVQRSCRNVKCLHLGLDMTCHHGAAAHPADIKMLVLTIITSLSCVSYY